MKTTYWSTTKYRKTHKHKNNKSFKQCETNSGNSTPVLVIKRNREKPKIVMDLDQWLKIIK